MGSAESLWIAVEFICRILGVSTATVLCAVGVETIQQGEFNSLGIYLLVSSVGIMIFEMAYFLDALLMMCLPCPPDWQLFVLWGKMANVGGFHKFLYYSIMSVVCFLHPVLLWHAIIPGTMLLVTAVFNFILSKKHNSQPPKRPQEIYSDHSICVTEGGGSDSRFSFLPVVVGRRGESLALNSVDTDLGLREQGESVRTVLDREQTDQRKRHWRDSICFRGREEPVEREMKEMDQYSEPEVDTTSDTAPMITN
ncbi:transmembrane protein 72 [Gouania willdenowi]|uniref:transmembrane protein 72 n=1 Tax=Gouania willdenowi TaxID=441366 RepID=UPI0010569CD3|nr:transmembrane protein 72 [Gouania willdenowi]